MARSISNSPRRDTSSSRVTPPQFGRFPQQFAGNHLYTWVERGNVRVKCLVQEHNIMSPARARIRTARSGVERINHEGTLPPTISGKMFWLFKMSGKTSCINISVHSFWNPPMGVSWSYVTFIDPVFDYTRNEMKWFKKWAKDLTYLSLVFNRFGLNYLAHVPNSWEQTGYTSANLD